MTKANPPRPWCFFLRGDHELNEVKAEKPWCGLALAVRQRRRNRRPRRCCGFVGPKGLKAKVYVDRAAAHMADFVCGANEKTRT